MDYFSVLILVIITFIFVTDKKIKSIEEIIKQNGNKKIKWQIKRIKQKMVIIKIDFDKIPYKKLQCILENNKYDYIFLKNKLLNINNNEIEILIANFVNNKEKMSGFNLRYNTNSKNKLSFKRLYFNIINYLNIFNRNDLSTFGVVILNKKDVKNLIINNSKVVCKNMVSFTHSDIVNIQIYVENINNINNNKLNYVSKKIYNSNFKIILKFLLLIISGYYVTSNLIISVINIQNNIYNFLTAITIYLCYLFILKYIYKPIGKSRWIATDMFFILFLLYPFIVIYMFFLNKK